MPTGGGTLSSSYARLQEAIEDNGGVVCEQVPFVFFYEDEFDKRTDEREKVRLAKEICKECPVRLLCLEYALEANERYGIWGGTTHKERKKLRRSRGRFYQDNPWAAAG